MKTCFLVLKWPNHKTNCGLETGEGNGGQHNTGQHEATRLISVCHSHTLSSGAWLTVWWAAQQERLHGAVGFQNCYDQDANFEFLWLGGNPMFSHPRWWKKTFKNECLGKTSFRVQDNAVGWLLCSRAETDTTCAEEWMTYLSYLQIRCNEEKTSVILSVYTSKKYR